MRDRHYPAATDHLRMIQQKSRPNLRQFNLSSQGACSLNSIRPLFFVGVKSSFFTDLIAFPIFQSFFSTFYLLLSYQLHACKLGILLILRCQNEYRFLLIYFQCISGQLFCIFINFNQDRLITTLKQMAGSIPLDIEIGRILAVVCRIIWNRLPLGIPSSRW